MKISPRLARVALISFGVAVVAYVIAWFLPKSFEANASLLFPQSQASAGGLEQALTGGAPGGSDQAVSFFNNLFTTPLLGSGQKTALGILTSQTCYRDVAKRLGLPEKWEISSNDAWKKVKEDSDIKIDKNGFLTIKTLGRSPEQAKAIAAEFVHHLKTRSADLSVDTGTKNREFLEDQAGLQRQNVLAAKSSLEGIMKSSQYADVSAVNNRYIEALQQYADAERSEATARATLELIGSTNTNIYNLAIPAEGTDTTALNNLSSTFTEMVNTIMARRQGLEDAMSMYTKGSLEVKTAEIRVKTAEQLAEEVAKKYATLLKKGLTPAQQKARIQLETIRVAKGELKKSLDKYQDLTKKAPAQFADVSLAQSHFTVALETERQYLIELQKARIVEALKPALFQIVDEPMSDQDPVAPGKAKIAILAFLFALVIQAAPWAASKLKEQPE